MAEPQQQRLKKYPKFPCLADPFLMVLITCLFLYLWVPIGQSASAKTSNSALPSDPSAGDARTNHLLSADQFKKEIQKYIGIPYRMGGASLKGMDCSGLIKRIYAKLFGIDLPHNSSQQSRLPFLETVSAKDLKTGDLIFFGPRGRRINHVGVYLAEGKFMYAGRRLGVTIASLNTNYWKSRFIVSKRIKGLALTDNNEEDLHPYAPTDSPKLDSGIFHGLHYRSSDDRRFSVSAKHEWNSSANFQNNSLTRDTPQDDLHLQLDSSF
jgi:NlpC/P60 family